MLKRQVYHVGMVTLYTLFCLGFSSQETSVDNKNKNKINFFGTLKTTQNKVYDVENISINRLISKIPLYEAPVKSEGKEPYDLANDPRKGPLSRIDLTEIQELRAHNPEITWSYKKANQTFDYIEIEVTFADAKKTKHHYLIESNRKIICDEIINTPAAQPSEHTPRLEIEKEVPVQAIQSLHIKGFKSRDAVINKAIKNDIQNP